MNLFVEKEFFEEFELDYFCSDKKTEPQVILFQLFNQYSYIRLYTNASLEFIGDSELLSRLTDNNANVYFDVDLDQYFQSYSGRIFQTLIFTKEPKDWFQPLILLGALCFSFSDYESRISEFIKKTHLKVDLSDPENLPFKWNKFRLIYEHSNLLIISDPYILADKSQQKLKNNLIQMLKENLDQNHDYIAFIFTDVEDETTIELKIKKIYSDLSAYRIKLFVFNRLKYIEKMDIHDRIIYSNYTISESGIGFNLSSYKMANSQIICSSIFEKYTYKRLCNHLSELSAYINKLEKLNHINTPFKANSCRGYDAFRDILQC
ncbi:hypothetical protein BA6E_1026 [Bacteroidales bacterium 6E]|nr:hypothetical protein BA6E_1026 [Bacteroidales bacterium 6E]